MIFQDFGVIWKDRNFLNCTLNPKYLHAELKKLVQMVDLTISILIS